MRCFRGRPDDSGQPPASRADARPSKAKSAPQRRIRVRSASARPGLLMTTVPTAMSCSRRLRALNRPTSAMNGVRKLTLTH